MSDEHHSGLLYGLEQRIPPLPAFFSALQHVLAALVGIITPPLIIGATLGLGDWLPYLISMSLLASGIGTFLQSNRVWGIGAGMICMQGTSFAFLGVTVAGGMWVKAQGGGPQDMMAMLFGVNFVAALVPVIVSRFIEPLKKIFTPIITGSVIALIGISLIKVSVINWCGGEKAEDFASMSNIALGAGTLGVIVLLSCAKNRWLRLSSVVVGIAVGCIAAGLSGQFHLHSLGDTLFRLPTLFPFGFQFNSAIFLPVALVSLVCILEAVGDLTANSLISQQSVDDRAFRNRLKGGILADGELLRQIPAPVLGGATMVMFGCVVAAGIRIITQTPLSRRDVLIVGLAFGAGLGVESVPAFLSHFPPMVGDLFGSAATSGGLVAIALNLILPQEQAATKSLRSQDDRAESV
ncbi:solute carrier family 23 protein [Klebsiella pneumoniae]|uniref:solute carrier family 23 protein n=1 Tax=Klebsiella pneumoniae TaxID=573 RepID=UPI003D03311D